MSWVLDIAVVLVAVICLVFGARRGFIKSAIRLIGLVTALCVAGLVSTPLAAWIFDSFLNAPIRAAVAERAASAAALAAQTVQEQVAAVIEAMPSVVQRAYELSGFVIPEHDATLATKPLTQLVMDNVLRPLTVSVLQAVLFLVLFLLVFLVAFFIGKAVNKLFTTLPVIRQVNAVLGGALGLFEGVAVVYVLSLVLRLYMTMSGADSVITTADIEASYLWQPIMTFRLFG